tara:strand:- start:2315 stop:2683 length:369 start_codon:yes stop_codon:yes gene_type:complete
MTNREQQALKRIERFYRLIVDHDDIYLDIVAPTFNWFRAESDDPMKVYQDAVDAFQPAIVRAAYMLRKTGDWRGSVLNQDERLALRADRQAVAEMMVEHYVDRYCDSARVILELAIAEKSGE